MSEPVHGRYSTYTNHGCKCDLCRNAMREYRRNLHYRRKTGEPKRQRNTTPPPINISAILTAAQSRMVKEAWVKDFADWRAREQETDQAIITDLATRARETVVYGRSVTACPRNYWSAAAEIHPIPATIAQHDAAKERNRARSRLYQRRKRLAEKVGVRKRYAR